MELSFFKGEYRPTSGSAAERIDYDVLTATLAAVQSVTPTARAVRRGRSTLVRLLLASAHAIGERQGGAFNPAIAMRLAKAASTEMKGPFTFAFQSSFKGRGVEPSM